MKKTLIPIILVLVLIGTIPLSVSAVEPKATAIIPGLSFNGTTAICTLTVSADSTDSIYATIKLWNGNTCVKTWYKSATEILSFRDTTTVSRNTTYTLTADVLINNVSQPQASTSRTCS